MEESRLTERISSYNEKSKNRWISDVLTDLTEKNVSEEDINTNIRNQKKP